MKPFFDSTLPRGGDYTSSAPVAIILGLGVLVSVLIAQTIQSNAIRQAKADFQIASEQTFNLIEDRVDNQIELIRSIVSFFNSSQTVNRTEFNSFVADSLRRHPSIQLVGWAPRTPGSQREIFEQAVRAEGLNNYQINERSVDGRPVPAAPRPEYFPNLFVQPQPSAESTYGLDHGSDPIRRASLERALESGDLVFSDRFELPLAPENRTAILAYAPVFRDGKTPVTVQERRDQLVGYAYGVVRPSSIVQEILKTNRAYAERNGPGMRIDVFDTTEPQIPKHLFFYSSMGNDETNGSSNTIAKGPNDFLNTVTFGGRQWTFVSRPQGGVLAGQIATPTLLAFGGLLFLSLLLTAYIHSVTNRSRAIEAEVSQRTIELRQANELLHESEDRIRLITDSVPVRIAYVDQNLIYRFANRAYLDIGIDPANLVGQQISEARREVSYEQVKPYFERAARGERISFETEVSDGNGNTRYNVVECTPNIQNGVVRGFYILGRTVTEQRNAENELKRTNDLLRDSEDRIRVITNSVPALIAYIDRDLIYRFANQRYRDIGIDPEQLIGETVADRRGDGTYEKMKPYFEQAARGEAVSFEITSTDPNGQTRYRAIDCTPDISEGEARGFYVLGRDVTEQRNAQNEINRAYDLLRSSEERLRIITNSLPALIAHVDRNMRVRYANERFNILSIETDEVVGKPLRSVIGEERFADLRISCERALLGEPSQLEVSVSTREGQQISVLTDFTPDISSDGQIDGFYFVALNVTAQRALEIELDRFFRQSLSFMCVATFDGFLRRFNDTWSTALGYSHDELVSTPYFNFIHPDEKEKVNAALRRLGTDGEITNLEIRMLQKNGGERIILWNAAADRHERQIYATGHDITDIKAVDRMKDEFVSTVSHELRTPLTSIKGALGLMRAKTFGTLAPDMNTMLEIAYKNCDRLVLLINDILDIEKIEAGKMDFRFEPVEIVASVRSAVSANQAYADQFGVKLIVETNIPSAIIRGDEGRLMQVMANLLSNAAKFSPEGGQVTVGVIRIGSAIRISVKDNGPGISESFRGRIFEKFSQHDSSDRRIVSGTGLGLSIVRAIVDRHGGRVNFETESGKGTTFHVDFPEADPAAAPTDNTPSMSRLLICEDDPDVAMVLRKIIENYGYEADIALSGAEAMSLLGRRQYVGMTLDLVLPDVSGIEFLRRLRANPRTHFLPVIIVSATATESIEKINGNAINIVDWLDKPLDEKRLASAIRAAITMNATTTSRILHIEDNSDLIQVVARQIGENADFVSSGTIAASKQILGRERFDLVILDLILPDGRGEELLPLMRNPDGKPIPVIIFSASEVPAEVARRVQAVLVKTRSTDRMLLDAIDELMIRRSKNPDDDAKTNPIDGMPVHG